MLLAVPNVSEGADTGVVSRLAEAFGSEATLLDTHSDPIHARSVFTLAGPPGALERSLLAGAAEAIELIDVVGHRGAHPRIGSLDVCPLVYPDHGLAAEAQGRARELSSDLGELGVPVFLYGELASTEERRERHHFRRGGLEGIAGRMAAGELRPDFGPAAPHPRGGAVLVTSRPPLAAFNVELEGLDLEAAREIAGKLRESGGGLAGVRALAIPLESGRLQISTNIHDPLAVPLAAVVAEVERLARELGGTAVEAELVGLIPEQALAGYPEAVPIRDFDPARCTIEARIAVI